MRYHVHGRATLASGEELAITISVDAESDSEAQRLAWRACDFDVDEIETEESASPAGSLTLGAKPLCLEFIAGIAPD